MGRHGGSRRELVAIAFAVGCYHQRRVISQRKSRWKGWGGGPKRKAQSGEAGGRKNLPTKLQPIQCRDQITKRKSPVRVNQDLEGSFVAHRGASVVNERGAGSVVEEGVER